MIRKKTIRQIKDISLLYIKTSQLQKLHIKVGGDKKFHIEYVKE
jgi:hypothetical protein